MKCVTKEFLKPALAGVAQWIECQPVNWKDTGLILSQGICLSCTPGPQLRAWERQPIDISLAHQCFPSFLSPSLPFSLQKTFKESLKPPKFNPCLIKLIIILCLCICLPTRLPASWGQELYIHLCMPVWCLGDGKHSTNIGWIKWVKIREAHLSMIKAKKA